MKGWRERWRVPKLRVTRDTVLFLSGLGGIVHETFFTKLDRPDLLVLFMAMVGLPAFLRQDEYRRFRNSFPSRQSPMDAYENTDANREADRDQRPSPGPSPGVRPAGGDYDDLDAG